MVSRHDKSLTLENEHKNALGCGDMQYKTPSLSKLLCRWYRARHQYAKNERHKHLSSENALAANHFTPPNAVTKSSSLRLLLRSPFMIMMQKSGY